jgi:sarcosine oxidase
MAEKYGAELRFRESLVTWEQVDESLFRVTTDRGNEYFTKKLVLSVGPWAPDVYGSSIPIPLHVERRVLFWFRPPNTDDLREFSKIPIYIWDLGEKGNFYGFPLQGGEPKDGVKVAMHYVDAKVGNYSY